jgi:hypothetical protein
MQRALRLAAILLLSVCVSDALAQQPGDCGYYTNSDGNRVPRPCKPASDQQCPQDATALCRDGTCSYSQHHSGTCSGHGGVQSWLR